MFGDRLEKCVAGVGLVFCLSWLLTGCNPEASGFSLPKGDPERGKAAFVGLRCNHCHSVANTVRQAKDQHPTIEFELGGYVTNVRTYGDLVTSIINPSHRISGGRNVGPHLTEDGGSKMVAFNDVMTVQQLIDIAEFLRESYEVVPPSYTPVHYGI